MGRLKDFAFDGVFLNAVYEWKLFKNGSAIPHSFQINKEIISRYRL